MYNPQLETFIRVADAGSFNKAAEELFISPPAVIKQINLLEAQLGLTLFVRTHRGLKLTEAGKSLYQDAKYVIGYCRESVERARAAMQKEENVIRIGTSPMTPVQNMVDLWPKFQEYCPDIKFQMIPFENTPENAREILKNLGKNIDVIAGIFDESMLNYRQCSGTELCRVPLCCAVSVNHRLAKKKRLTIQDLYGENLLLMHRGWSHYVDCHLGLPRTVEDAAQGVGRSHAQVVVAVGRERPPSPASSCRTPDGRPDRPEDPSVRRFSSWPWRPWSRCG